MNGVWLAAWCAVGVLLARPLPAPSSAAGLLPASSPRHPQPSQRGLSCAVRRRPPRRASRGHAFSTGATRGHAFSTARGPARGRALRRHGSRRPPPAAPPAAAWRLRRRTRNRGRSRRLPCPGSRQSTAVRTKPAGIREFLTAFLTASRWVRSQHHPASPSPSPPSLGAWVCTQRGRHDVDRRRTEPHGRTPGGGLNRASPAEAGVGHTSAVG